MPICPKCHHRSEELGAPCPRDNHHFIPDSSLDDVAAQPRLGTSFDGRFIPLRVIDHTHLATLFEALQLPVRRRVALKILAQSLRHSTKARERFSREARAISSLTHPNAVTLHDFGFDDEGHPFLVQELVVGPTLTEWARQPSTTLDRLLTVWNDLLAAMAEAHDRGLVHRALDPSKLIVTRAGHRPDMLKIRDFGLVKNMTNRQQRQLTGDEEVLGTPTYMAPEQSKNPDQVGPHTDVYSLGILLYECLTGTPPFEADSPMELVFEHLTTPMPDLTEHARFSLPDGLADIVTLATAKEPTRRFSNAQAFYAAFQEIAGRPTYDTSPTPAPAPTDTQEPDTDELRRRPQANASSFERTLESHFIEDRLADEFPEASTTEEQPRREPPADNDPSPPGGLPSWPLIAAVLLAFLVVASLAGTITWFLLTS